MKTWEFTDRVTGEDFFVEAPCIEDAVAVAVQYFERPVCFGEISLELAEGLGYDTY